MKLFRDISNTACRPSAAAIGFFDGVHRGHRYLIEQVRAVAAKRGLAASVVTFPVHPRKVMQPGCRLQLLTTCEEKVSLLAGTGIDQCLMLDFTPEVSRLSARQFMAHLKERYRIEALVIGYDHRFGHNRSEDFADYVRYGEELDIEVLRARAFSYYDANHEERTVSSSTVRRLLLEGDVTAAAECLGYDYFLNGTVVGGYQVGRKIGFPTANLRPSDPDKVVPADGVYAVRVLLEEKEYGGMLSIGTRPTLDNGPDRSIEVHIFDFNADIYRLPMRVSFVQRTRAELKFDSVNALVSQLHRDEAEVKIILAR